MGILDLMNQIGIEETNDTLERIEKKIDVIIKYLNKEDSIVGETK